MSFAEVCAHRLKYFLSPQLDLYKNISNWFTRPAGSAPTVLDYGCGNGVGTLRLCGHNRWIYGIDSDGEAINLARDLFGNLGIVFMVGDWATEKKECKHPLDLITCIEVIEHVKSPRTLLENFKTWLPSDGAVVISTLNHNSQYRKNPGHVGKFKVADFRRLVAEYFPGVRICDYTLRHELEDDSTITPMVAVWKGKKA